MYTVMNKPLVITTFRSGSTVLTEMLATIAVEYLGFKKYLDEPFTMMGYGSQHHAKTFGSYKNSDGEDILYTSNYSAFDKSNATAESRYKERLRRLDLLKNNPHTYMFKVMADITLPPEVVEWCSNERSPIFLERRDRMAQLVSWCSYLQHPPHYTKSSQQRLKYTINHINYNRDMCLYFIKSHIHAYDEWKKKYSSAPVIYFEDIIDSNPSKKLCSLMGVEDNITIEPKYLPVPYAKNNREDLIRSPGWKQDRAMLEQLIYSEM